MKTSTGHGIVIKTLPAEENVRIAVNLERLSGEEIKNLESLTEPYADEAIFFKHHRQGLPETLPATKRIDLLCVFRQCKGA